MNKRFSIFISVVSFILLGYGQNSMAQLQLPSQSQANNNGFQQTGELSTDVSNASGAFVGADSADATNFRSMNALGGLGGMSGMGGMGGMGMGGMGMMGMGGMGRGGMGGMGRGGTGRGGMGGNNNDPRAQLRIPMRIGFVRPAIDYVQVSTVIQTRLTKIPTLAEENNVNVVLAAGVVTLSGTVSSERDRSVIERLMMLEPGVRSVQNDLSVTE